MREAGRPDLARSVSIPDRLDLYDDRLEAAGPGNRFLTVVCRVFISAVYDAIP